MWFTGTGRFDISPLRMDEWFGGMMITPQRRRLTLAGPHIWLYKRRLISKRSKKEEKIGLHNVLLKFLCVHVELRNFFHTDLDVLDNLMLLTGFSSLAARHPN